MVILIRTAPSCMVWNPWKIFFCEWPVHIWINQNSNGEWNRVEAKFKVHYVKKSWRAQKLVTVSRDYEVDTEWGELHRLAGNKKTYRKKYASMKRCSSLLIIRETPAVKYHLTPVRMAIIKMSTNKICWRGCEEKGTLLHCWWECKLVKPWWKTVQRFLRKLKIELACDPAIPLPGHISGKDED